MKSFKKGSETLIKEFQEASLADELLDKYKNFLSKYHQLLYKGVIDFNNYDIRKFLSCYLKDSDERRSFLKGKYHSKQDVANGYRILSYIRQAFQGFTSREVYHELIIPFLECAKRYRYINKSFNSYLYNTYRYELVRHINSILFQRFNVKHPLIEKHHIEIELKENVDELKIELDDDLSLNHPHWLNGKKTNDPFKQFTREERLILVKYYMEDYTDKEIGRLIGKHRKSVNRMRLKAIRKIKEDISKGEIKWIKLMP